VPGGTFAGVGVSGSTLPAAPSDGRSYAGSRAVRLGDVTPKGRLRLDALARYLQDVANDDATDAIGGDAMAWVVRKTVLELHQLPVFREPLTLTTWGSGLGSRWAERRTSVVGERGGRVEAASVWVHVDLATGRPKKLLPAFADVYGPSAAGREVTARLTHPDPPPDAPRHPWPLRFADFDVVAHVNNAVYWAMVEEHLDVRAGTTLTLEYRGGIDRHQAVEVTVTGDAVWILADGAVAASVSAEPSR
jgi:acyl-ACP thioesterase